MSITVKHLTKSFGTFVALNDVSLEVPDGELLALVTLLIRKVVEARIETRLALLRLKEDGDGQLLREAR